MLRIVQRSGHLLSLAAMVSLGSIYSSINSRISKLVGKVDTVSRDTINLCLKGMFDKSSSLNRDARDPCTCFSAGTLSSYNRLRYEHGDLTGHRGDATTLSGYRHNPSSRACGRNSHIEESLNAKSFNGHRLELSEEHIRYLLT